MLNNILPFCLFLLFMLKNLGIVCEVLRFFLFLQEKEFKMGITIVLICLAIMLCFDLKGVMMLIMGIVIGYVACLRGFDYKDYMTVTDNDIVIHAKQTDDEKDGLEK